MFIIGLICKKKVQHCLLILMLFKVFENIYTL